MKTCVYSWKIILFLFDPFAGYGMIGCVSPETRLTLIYGFLPCFISPGGTVNGPEGGILITYAFFHTVHDLEMIFVLIPENRYCGGRAMFVLKPNHADYIDVISIVRRQIRRSKLSWFISMCISGLLIGAMAMVGMWAYRLHKKAEMLRKVEFGRYEILRDQYPRLTPRLYAIISEECTRHHVRIRVICAIIDQESAWRRYAVSPSGAKGYMQLMPETADSLGVDDVFDPRQNIRAGIGHYVYCLRKAKGDHSLAFKYYNGGQNRVTFSRESEEYSKACMARISKSESILLAML